MMMTQQAQQGSTSRELGGISSKKLEGVLFSMQLPPPVITNEDLTNLDLAVVELGELAAHTASFSDGAFVGDLYIRSGGEVFLLDEDTETDLIIALGGIPKDGTMVRFHLENIETEEGGFERVANICVLDTGMH